jgi:osmotically-inducible protein OsmY
MMNNTQLEQAVRDELRFDPSVDDAGITMAIKDGAVSLAGFAPSYSQKRFATKAAQRVGGVRSVTDEIKVNLPASVKLSDQEIATRANQSLSWEVSIPEHVKATVQNGAVTLTGEVPHQFQKTAAERNISRLYGVTGVTNNIALKPTSEPTAGTEANISKAFKRLAIEGQNVTVTADKGKVSLKGTLPNAYQRELAGHAAWSEPGVTQVNDGLSIN